MTTPGSAQEQAPRPTHLTLRLTGREADALHGTLSVILNDPDWFEGDQQTGAGVRRVAEKLWLAISEATK